MREQVGYMKKFPEGRIRSDSDRALGEVLRGVKPQISTTLNYTSAARPAKG